MKSTILALISVLIFSSLVLVSCLRRKPAEPVTIEKTRTVKEVVKDTIYQLEADSSFYYAFVECVNGKPIIKEPATTLYKNLPKSKTGKVLRQPKVILTGNVLSVQCYKQAQEIFKQWRETYIQEHEKNTLTEYVEKPFKWYHKTLMWIGGIFLLLSAIGIILKLKT